MKIVDQNDISVLHNTFLMFGDPESPFWFLGLEEGDHPRDNQDIDDFIHGLLRKTEKYADAGTISLRELCAPADGYKYLPKIDPAKDVDASGTVYQRTWGGYIKLLLSVHMAGSGDSWSFDDVKKYQKYDLGSLTLTGDYPGSCLMELFPMARKGRKSRHWPYGELSSRKGLEFFESSKWYQAQVEKPRVKQLIERVDRYNPSYLICFGAPCRNAIRSVIDVKEERLAIWQGKGEIDVPIVKYRDTLIVYSKHPTSHGISDLYWKNLGNRISEITEYRSLRHDESNPLKSGRAA